MTRAIRFSKRRSLVLALVAMAMSITFGSVAAAAEIVIESAAFHDPTIEPTPATKSFHPKLKSLWLEALARPESDYQREAADAIARAHASGMPGLTDAVKPLADALSKPEQRAVVKMAAARALILMDAKETAPQLQQLAQTEGAEFAALIEPALLKWKYEPMRQVWLERLSAPSASREMVVLAIRGLAESKEKNASSNLRELVTAPSTPQSVKLEAARALGRLQTEGLLDDAKKLAASKSATGIVDRLCAASMLGAHSGTDAEALLSELALDEEPTVAGIALARLLEIQPVAILSHRDKLAASRDANVRHFVVKALVAKPNTENVEKLSAFLNDPDTAVRVDARNALYTFAADAQYKDIVIRKATEMLAGKEWRGLEQSSILLAGLDHKDAAPRIAELLEFEKPEVYIASAWALRKLQVASTLPAMLQRAKKTVDLLSNAKQLTDTNAPPDMLNQQLRDLFEAFGLMKYIPAAEVLAKFVPKGGPWEINTRCVAIWAGGYILQGVPESDIVDEVVRAFASRLNDINGPNPEDDRVRRMAAISLGRMKAKSALGSLRTHYALGQTSRIVGYACAWSIRQITGEDIGDPPAPDFPQRGWFLEPLD